MSTSAPNAPPRWKSATAIAIVIASSVLLTSSVLHNWPTSRFLTALNFFVIIGVLVWHRPKKANM